MHINEALLLAYQDAGATSSNLTEAEYQALVANGAADGKWHTFLRAAGWTGCLDEMMYAYLGDKGYAGTLGERLHQAAAALDLFRAAYSPIDEFSGGKNGWLFNGAANQSTFLQASGGAVAVDGDPLGYISDLSGNSNNIVQATGGSKPVCRINGGISSAYFTSNKSLGVTFATPMQATRTEAWVIKVMANTPSAEAYPHVLSGAGGLDFQFIRNSATNKVEVNTGTFASAAVTCPAYGNTFIFVEQKSANGSGDVSVFTYNSSGSLVSSALHGPNNSAATATSMTLGLAAAMIPFHIPFSMGIEGLPDTTDLVAYLADTFGAWSPT